MMLWDALAPPWQACLEEAWAAYCAGSIPVGAVVTDGDGRIMARGRNRTFERDAAPVPHAASSPRQVSPLAHAEVEALAGLDYATVDPHGCILYASHEPCPLCLGALYMSGVRELRYAGRDPYAGSVNLLRATPYLSRKPIRLVPPASADLEAAVTAAAVEFGLRYGLRAAPVVWLEAWRAVLPDGVRLGEAVFASGWLQEMREHGAAAAAVVDGLAAQLRAG